MTFYLLVFLGLWVFPSEEPGEGDLADVEAFVSGHYADLSQRVARVFDEGEDQKGIMFFKGGAGLWVDGGYHPRLVALSASLDFLIQWMGQTDLREQAEAELLARGFPADEISLLARARGGGASRQGFWSEKRRVLEVRWQETLDPDYRASDRELAAFYEELVAARWEANRAWTIGLLGQLSLPAREVLVAYADNELNRRFGTRYYRPRASEEMIEDIRQLKQKSRRMRVWSPSSGAQRGPTPPRLILGRAGDSVIWVSARGLALSQDARPKILSGSEALTDLLPGQSAGFFMTLEEEVEKTLAGGLSRRSGDCAIMTQRIWHHEKPTRFRDLFSKAIAIMEAEVRQIDAGFYYGRPGSLVTVAVSKWYREPLAGSDPLFYLYDENVSFQLDGVSFCAIGLADFQWVPGKRMLLFVTNPPVDALAAVLHVNPYTVIVETDAGFSSSPGLLADPALSGIEGFAALGPLIERLATEAPFEIDILSEILP